MRRGSSRQIHGDWGEAQGNYDELRFFTGLRPSEEIDAHGSGLRCLCGTLRVSKARVAGLDKDCTKTGERSHDHAVPARRRVLITPARIALPSSYAQGKIRHDHLFFKSNGEPIRNLQYTYVRW